MLIGKRATSWGIRLIMLLVLAVGANRMDGQEPPSEPAIAAIDRAWPDVNLNVIVVNKSGELQKIDEQTFQLFEDHTERPLRLPAAPDSPVSVALLIDSSGSTYKRRPEIMSAVTAIVKALPTDSEVMAISFSQVAFLEFPFTSVSKVNFSFMDRVPAAGPTALYDAVAATEDYIIANAKYLRRALIVLSDGQNNASQVSMRRAYGMMERPGAPMVYLCLIAKASYFQPQAGVGRINMNFLAKGGGGLTFNLDPDPTATAADMVTAIRSQYVLQFTSADPAHDGKQHKLALRLPIKDVKIYGLPDYFAPAR